MTSARAQGSEPGIGLQYWSVCTHLPKAGISPARSTARGKCENCTSSTTGRGTNRERCKESASVGGTGRRSARSAQPGNPREPGFYWRSLEAPRYQVNASHCVFYLTFENDDCWRARVLQNDENREERIRTFMQLELEACLEEVSWMLRCHNCEVLDCPQEEYPARLLPTPPPSYIDNLQSRLIKARKWIFPASLKIILKIQK